MCTRRIPDTLAADGAAVLRPHGVARHRVPHTQRLEHAPCRRRDRRGAQIWPRAIRKCRIGHYNTERIPEPLTQRQRERETGESTARDHHIGFLSAH